MEGQEDRDAEGAGRQEPPSAPAAPEDRAPRSKTGTPHSDDNTAPTKDKFDRDLVRWTGAIAIFTAVLVIASILQFWAMHGQMSVMQGQLDEMQWADRAWVSIKPVAGSVIWDEDGVSITLQYNIKNSGSSPAMHVTMQDAMVPSIADPGPLIVLRKMTSDQRKFPPGLIGGPLFPHDDSDIFSTQKFTRKQMADYFRYLTTFKHASTDPDRPLDTVNKMLMLTMVYFVDYTFGTDPTHHQSACMVRITRLDPQAPLNVEVELPVDVNLPPSEVRLVNAGLGCEAG